MRMRFEQRPNLLCPPSAARRHSTPPRSSSLQSSCNSLESCFGVHEFSKIPTIPAEIRTSPPRMCSLLTTVNRRRFCPEARSQRPALVKGAFKWQIRRKQQLLQVPREGSERDSSKHS